MWGCNSIISGTDRASGGQFWGGLPYLSSSTSGSPPASTAAAQQWIPLRYSCAALLQWVALSRVAVSLALGCCEPSGISLDSFTAYSAGAVALGASQSCLVPLAHCCFVGKARAPATPSTLIVGVTDRTVCGIRGPHNCNPQSTSVTVSMPHCTTAPRAK